MAQNINRVIVTGNLTRDPELNNLPSGTSVCDLRIAVNGRRKDNQSGEWVDKPNYFNVKVWGAQGENAARYLAKGRAVAVDGRLDWREWEDQQGNKRQSIDIIADTVQFLGGRDDAAPGGNGGFAPSTGQSAGVDQSDFQAAGVGSPGAGSQSAPADDDIPF
ncbi:MAG: single-stranded DNA-binding protein [Solirubrobacterales bacterium]